MKRYVLVSTFVFLAGVLLISACLEKPDPPPVDGPEVLTAEDSLIVSYVEEFNMADYQMYVQAFSNAAAAEFMMENIPVFECPDKELEKTYYFRWWTFRKHIKQTVDGYVITEFLPEVSWSGKHNAICCPAMHQFVEGRWLKDATYLNDYAHHWCRNQGDARTYSFPSAYSYLELYKVHMDVQLLRETYADLKKMYSRWYERRWDEKEGMFWQYDGADGMEVSISGGMTEDDSGYRATINSYMYADAVALAHMASILSYGGDQEYYLSEAEKLAAIVNDRLWDESARFYKVIPRFGNMSFSPAREQHGYVPWMFGIPGVERNDAWLQLTDPQGFKAPYGPTTAEQRAEGFKVVYSGHECQWNGPSWPFATAQTLTALARTLHRDGESAYITKNAYFETLQTYSNSHRRVNDYGQTICWIDENLDPFTGEWIARKMLLRRSDYQIKERGKDYNHSSFCDLIISGLMGIQPQLDGSVVIEPLLPEGEWDYFSLSRIHCAGKEISLVYDRTGKHYDCEPGLTVYVDGKAAAHADTYVTRIVL